MKVQTEFKQSSMEIQYSVVKSSTVCPNQATPELDYTR